MEDWTEKYRPKSLTELIGNERALSALRAWAQAWKRGTTPKKRAVVLSGKPGTGKTSSALALAQDLGWIPVELNASDARNAVKIRKIATSGAVNETLDGHGRYTPSRQGGRKLIILDEADNLYERIQRESSTLDFSDAGGKKAIVETIKITNQPIILIVNDYYSLTKGGGEVLRHLCTMIPFYGVNASQIVELLKRICREENITADLKLLQTLAERCKGDARSAINDLQSICLNRQRIDVTALDAVGYRDREKIIFDAMRDVFKTKTVQDSKDILYNVDIQPETFLLWIAENLPREYLAVEDLTRGYDAVSTADLFFGRVSKRQYYGLWSYACDIMNGGVAIAKTHAYGNTRYYAPTWMKEMKTHKPLRGLRDSVIKKISSLSHNSSKKTKEYILPHFSYVFRNNVRFASMMKKRLDLSEGEIKYILGDRYLHKLKEILEYSEKADEKQAEIDMPPLEQQEKDVGQEEHKQDMKQPSIFDF